MRDARQIGAGGVLDGQLNLVGDAERRLDGPADGLLLARGDADVDARPARAHERRARGIEILLPGPSGHGDRRRAHRGDDGANAGGVTRGAGLDDVDAQPLELRGDRGAILRQEGKARQRAAVAQRRIEDLDPAR